MAHICPDDREYLPSDDPILLSRYVNGTPVLRDFHFRGAPIILAVMRQFAALEQIPFTTFQYGQWTGTNRSDPRNYPYMLQGIREVLATSCPEAMDRHPAGN